MDGKWLNDEEVMKYVRGGETYRLYSLSKYIGEYETVAPESSAQRSYVRFKSRDPAIYAGVVGVAGDWNALPRVPRIQDQNLPREDAFIRGLLDKNGLPDVPVIIKQVVSIDLEGDGTEENFLVASNITRADIDTFAAGKENVRDNKYSIVVLRRSVEGRESNVLISAQYKFLVVHEILFIADVDNDGVLEFMINHESIEAVQAECFSVSTQVLYHIKDSGVEELSSVFVSPH